MDLFHQCQMSRSVSCLFPPEECRMELFHRCQMSRSVSCLFPLEECQMELFRQCQVSRSVSCHPYHHCLVVFPQKVHGRKTSLASPRKKLGTLTLNNSRH